MSPHPRLERCSLLEALVYRGVRLTAQRRALIEVIQEASDSFLHRPGRRRRRRARNRGHVWPASGETTVRPHDSVPSASLHYVGPMTRGARIASFFWIQSMVRDDGKRTLLFDLDVAIQRLNNGGGENPVAVQLTGVHHNRLRQWADI